MSAAVLQFPRVRRDRPSHWVPAPEAGTAERLFCRLSDRLALDRLVCVPAVQTHEGRPPRPLVVIYLDGADQWISADAARRLAVLIQAPPLSREGAAHDLIGAADMAEAMTFNLHRRT